MNTVLRSKIELDAKYMFSNKYPRELNDVACKHQDINPIMLGSFPLSDGLSKDDGCRVCLRLL